MLVLLFYTSIEVYTIIGMVSEQDFLGASYMELELGNDHAGQFFTPYSVCELMAKVAMPKDREQMGVREIIKSKGYVTINDCACGAGATLIAGVHEIKRECQNMTPPLNWQNHVLVVAQDIDMTVALMCYIQLSLQGAAGYIKIGNTLTDPITEKDDTMGYWYTPMYFSSVWATRRMLKTIDEMIPQRKEERKESVIVETHEVKPKEERKQPKKKFSKLNRQSFEQIGFEIF